MALLLRAGLPLFYFTHFRCFSEHSQTKYMCYRHSHGLAPVLRKLVA